MNTKYWLPEMHYNALRFIDSCERIEYAPQSVTLVRHAESALNQIDRSDPEDIKKLRELERKCGSAGDAAIPLSQKGERDARQFALASVGFFTGEYHLICSPYLRARRTMQIFLETQREYSEHVFVPKTCRLNDDVQERNLGDVLFMEQREIQENAPHFHYKKLEHREEVIQDFFSQPPNGESAFETYHRARRFTKSLCTKQHAEKNFLIFSHGRFIQSNMIHVNNMTLAQRNDYIFKSSIPNCSLTRFEFSRDERKFFVCYESKVLTPGMIHI